MVGAARFELATTCTPCRYATRLRYAPRAWIISVGRAAPAAPLGAERVQHFAQFALECGQIRAACGRARRARRRLAALFGRERMIEAIARAAYGEAFLVQQLANPADKQHLVVLVVASVAAALDRLELREFLLPVAKHMGLHPAQVAYLTDREVALRGDRRKLSLFAVLLHGAPSPPWPSASGWRER